MSIEAAKAILKLFNRRGFDAFFIGGKCRDELHNFYHPENLMEITDVDIITNAQYEDIKKIFPSCTKLITSFANAIITFAQTTFKIASYKKDNCNYAALKISPKVINTQMISAGTLDENRSHRDFTINSIVQDYLGNYIDYTYITKTEDISAMSDIRNQLIRAIGDPNKRFQEDPLRILRMFRFQSQLGYEIEDITYQAALTNKDLLEKMPLEKFADDFNKLLLGKFVIKAISNMKQFGFFNLKIDNHSFLNYINDISIEDLQRLEKYNNTENNKKSILEAYTLLFISSNEKVIKENLENSSLINDEDLQRILWINNHKSLFNGKNLQNKLFTAKDGIVKQKGRIEMLELIRHMSNILTAVINAKFGKNLYNEFCSKPYFFDQLRVTTRDLLKLTGKVIDKENEDNNKWIDQVKNAILKRLLEIQGNKWPYSYEDYMEYVKLGINDIFPDLQVNIPQHIPFIDDFGNQMDDQKARQYRRFDNDIIKLEDIGFENFDELEEFEFEKWLNEIELPLIYKRDLKSTV